MGVETTKKLKVELEGKTDTIEAPESELADRVWAFANSHGVERFSVNDAKGNKLEPTELGKVESVTLLRTEVAG